jgi:hypothetical protein
MFIDTRDSVLGAHATLVTPDFDRMGSGGSLLSLGSWNNDEPDMINGK